MNRVAHFQWLGLWAVGVGSDVDSGSLLGPEVSSMFRSRHCLSRLHERRRLTHECCMGFQDPA